MGKHHWKCVKISQPQLCSQPSYAMCIVISSGAAISLVSIMASFWCQRSWRNPPSEQRWTFVYDDTLMRCISQTSPKPGPNRASNAGVMQLANGHLFHWFRTTAMLTEERWFTKGAERVMGDRTIPWTKTKDSSEHNGTTSFRKIQH